MEHNIELPLFESLDDEHREGLLLCWKIREGFRKGIDVQRIKHYVNWYWQNYLSHLFDFEEQYIFSILPKDNRLRKKVLSQHNKLRKLFNEKEVVNYFKSLMIIEEELELHIRFAEKELQEEIKNFLSEDEVEFQHPTYFSNQEIEDWDDCFWK